MAIWDSVATERRRLADELETLTEAQWETASRCDGWTVEDVAAHLITPFEISTPRFMVSLLKNRTSLDRTMIELAEKVKEQNSRSDIVEKLRTNAASQWTPPGDGPAAPFAEIIVHGQDIRRALDMACTVPSETIAMALEGIKNEDTRANYASRIGTTDTPSS